MHKYWKLLLECPVVFFWALFILVAAGPKQFLELLHIAATHKEAR